MKGSDSNFTLKSMSSIPRVNTLKEKISRKSTVKSKGTMKSKSKSIDKEAMLTVSPERVDLGAQGTKSSERSQEEVNVFKTCEKRKPQEQPTNEKPMRQTSLSSSSNHISHAQDKTFIINKYDMSPRQKNSSKSQLNIENARQDTLQLPFNMPDEPSDSFELRISKKQLTF